MITHTDQEPGVLSVERRAELLARTPAEALVALAERCVAGGAPPTVISGPEVGMVMMTVREPIAHERFHADVIQLGRLTEQLELDRAEAEWDDFGPTRVNFNEID